MMYNKDTMVAERFKYFLLPLFTVFIIIFPALFLFPQVTNAQAATASCASAYIGTLLAPLATSLGLTGGAAAADKAALALGGTTQVVSVPVQNIPQGTQISALNTVNAAGNLNTGLGAAGATSLSFKACILTPLAEAMAARMLANITNSLVNWIQGGFNGNPAFVTNMGDFLSNTADQAIGEFIQNDPSLSLLCQPFSAQIRIALATEFSTQQYQGCTLTQVNKNISDFGNTFDAWNQWLQVTTVPANNQWGALVQEEGLLSEKVNDQLQSVNDEVNRNGGFLDVKVCNGWQDVNTGLTTIPGIDPYTVGKPVAGAPGTTEECTGGYTTETPGTVVSNALAGSYSAEFNKIGVSTDIDQIIGALVNELVSTTITGPNGLLGSGVPNSPISNTVDISTLAAQQSTSNAETISELNSEVAQAQIADASSTQTFLSANQPTTSTASTTTIPNSPSTFFVNPYPTGNPININSTSKFPTFSVGSVLSDQVAGLRAVITLKSENTNYTPAQIFDSSIYGLYMGYSNGTIIDVDNYALIQNGSITLANLSSNVSLFQFNLRPILVNQNPRLPIYNTYDLTITITDNLNQVLATQTAKFRMLMN